MTEKGTMGTKRRETPPWGVGISLGFRLGSLLICCVTRGMSLALSKPSCLYSKMKRLDLIRNS